MPLSRRTFLQSTSATLLTLAPGVRIAFGAESTTKRDILIVLFLRFGADGLSLVPPADDGNYHDARPTLGVSSKAALPLGGLDGVSFFLNPDLHELKPLYDSGSLAIVHAAGLLAENRSHFVSQDMMERGVADREPGLNTGWIARHLNAQGAALPLLGAVTAGANVDLAMRAYGGAVAIPDVTNFNVFGGDRNLNVISGMMDAGKGPHVRAGRQAVTTIRTVQATLAANPAAATGTDYPGGPLSTALRSVATVIKMGMGLEVAAVDYGGWDHHVSQAQFFPPLARELSQALAAFWNDMRDHRDRLTLVTMTEFGRRVKENSSGGTDHGAASCMFVLGNAVNGGKIYGTWPGLRPADLHAGDLRVTTDYRRVLQEILVARRAEQKPEAVFSTVRHSPLGIVRPI